MTTRVLVIGDGKMGRVVGEIAAARGVSVVGVYGPADMERPLVRGIADVAIEFTVPSAAAGNVRACLAAQIPIVSGTTGWDAELAVVRTEVEQTGGALLHAPNFSLGIQVFRRLVELAARATATPAPGTPNPAPGTRNPEPQSPAPSPQPPPLWTLSLTETHHAAKLDKPSGTAKMLARAVNDVLHRDLSITSHRIGDVTGTHELVLEAEFEKITLIHEARDRRVFADGAVAAAQWLIGRRGVFTFEDYVNDRLAQQ